MSACPTMGKRSRSQMVRELTALYGPLGMARLASRAGFSRILGRMPAARGAARFHSMAQLAKAYGIPLRRIGNPNAPAFLAVLADSRPDLLVSVACPYILKDRLLGMPPLGCINIHHAPLPRFKGMMPTFWQMYHGEKQVGVTVHYMAAKVDEGDALLQESLPIEENESLDHLDPPLQTARRPLHGPRPAADRRRRRHPPIARPLAQHLFHVSDPRRDPRVSPARLPRALKRGAPATRPVSEYRPASIRWRPWRRSRCGRNSHIAHCDIAAPSS